MLTLCLLMGMYSYSQRMITREINSFDELKVFDKIPVTLKKSQWNRVDIEGIQKDQIKIVEKNRTLKIRMSLDNLWSSDKTTKVTVYYTDIDIIDANEGARVFLGDTLVNKKLILKTQEGASIKGAIRTDDLLVKAISGGHLKLKGIATDQEIMINSGGSFEAKNLQSEVTNVRISAGGNASIYATDFVIAKTTAGGTIRIYGNPREIDGKRVLGGKIIEVN